MTSSPHHVRIGLVLAVVVGIIYGHPAYAQALTYNLIPSENDEITDISEGFFVALGDGPLEITASSSQTEAVLTVSGRAKNDAKGKRLMAAENADQTLAGIGIGPAGVGIDKFSKNREILSLSFDQPVSLRSITLSGLQNAEKAQIAIKGSEFMFVVSFEAGAEGKAPTGTTITGSDTPGRAVVVFDKPVKVKAGKQVVLTNRTPGGTDGFLVQGVTLDLPADAAAPSEPE